MAHTRSDELNKLLREGDVSLDGADSDDEHRENSDLEEDLKAALEESKRVAASSLKRTDSEEERELDAVMRASMAEREEKRVDNSPEEIEDVDEETAAAIRASLAEIEAQKAADQAEMDAAIQASLAECEHEQDAFTPPPGFSRAFSPQASEDVSAPPGFASFAADPTSTPQESFGLPPGLITEPERPSSIPRAFGAPPGFSSTTEQQRKTSLSSDDYGTPPGLSPTEQPSPLLTSFGAPPGFPCTSSEQQRPSSLDVHGLPPGLPCRTSQDSGISAGHSPSGSEKDAVEANVVYGDVGGSFDDGEEWQWSEKPVRDFNTEAENEDHSERVWTALEVGVGGEGKAEEVEGGKEGGEERIVYSREVMMRIREACRDAELDFANFTFIDEDVLEKLQPNLRFSPVKRFKFETPEQKAERRAKHEAAMQMAQERKQAIKAKKTTRENLEKTLPKSGYSDAKQRAYEKKKDQWNTPEDSEITDFKQSIQFASERGVEEEKKVTKPEKKMERQESSGGRWNEDGVFVNSEVESHEDGRSDRGEATSPQNGGFEPVDEVCERRQEDSGSNSGFEIERSNENGQDRRKAQMSRPNFGSKSRNDSQTSRASQPSKLRREDTRRLDQRRDGFGEREREYSGQSSRNSNDRNREERAVRDEYREPSVDLFGNPPVALSPEPPRQHSPPRSAFPSIQAIRSSRDERDERFSTSSSRRDEGKWENESTHSKRSNQNGFGRPDDFSRNDSYQSRATESTYKSAEEYKRDDNWTRHNSNQTADTEEDYHSADERDFKDRTKFSVPNRLNKKQEPTSLNQSSYRNNFDGNYPAMREFHDRGRREEPERPRSRQSNRSDNHSDRGRREEPERRPSRQYNGGFDDDQQWTQQQEEPRYSRGNNRVDSDDDYNARQWSNQRSFKDDQKRNVNQEGSRSYQSSHHSESNFDGPDGRQFRKRNEHQSEDDRGSQRSGFGAGRNERDERNFDERQGNSRDLFGNPHPELDRSYQSSHHSESNFGERNSTSSMSYPRNASQHETDRHSQSSCFGANSNRHPSHSNNEGYDSRDRRVSENSSQGSRHFNDGYRNQRQYEESNSYNSRDQPENFGQRDTRGAGSYRDDYEGDRVSQQSRASGRSNADNRSSRNDHEGNHRESHQTYDYPIVRRPEDSWRDDSEEETRQTSRKSQPSRSHNISRFADPEERYQDNFYHNGHTSQASRSNSGLNFGERRKQQDAYYNGRMTPPRSFNGSNYGGSEKRYHAHDENRQSANMSQPARSYSGSNCDERERRNQQMYEEHRQSSSMSQHSYSSGRAAGHNNNRDEEFARSRELIDAHDRRTGYSPRSDRNVDAEYRASRTPQEFEHSSSRSGRGPHDSEGYRPRTTQEFEHTSSHFPGSNNDQGDSRDDHGPSPSRNSGEGPSESPRPPQRTEGNHNPAPSRSEETPEERQRRRELRRRVRQAKRAMKEEWEMKRLRARMQTRDNVPVNSYLVEKFGVEKPVLPSFRRPSETTQWVNGPSEYMAHCYDPDTDTAYAVEDADVRHMYRNGQIDSRTIFSMKRNCEPYSFHSQESWLNEREWKETPFHGFMDSMRRENEIDMDEFKFGEWADEVEHLMQEHDKRMNGL